MKRGRTAATTTSAATPAARSASLVLDTAHRRLSEQAGGPDEEDREDHGQPGDEAHLATERRDVRAEQVQEDTEREAADHGAERAVEPAEDRRRERVQEDPLHHVRVEEDDRRDHHP